MPANLPFDLPGSIKVDRSSLEFQRTAAVKKRKMLRNKRKMLRNKREMLRDKREKSRDKREMLRDKRQKSRDKREMLRDKRQKSRDKREMLRDKRQKSLVTKEKSHETKGRVYSSISAKIALTAFGYESLFKPADRKGCVFPSLRWDYRKLRLNFFNNRLTISLKSAYNTSSFKYSLVRFLPIYLLFA